MPVKVAVNTVYSLRSQNVPLGISQNLEWLDKVWETNMFGRWLDLPAWLRLITSLLILVAGILIFLFANIRLGLVLTVVGCMLIIFSEKIAWRKKRI